MSHRAEIVTAISTLGCAIGIGFVMQSGEQADARYGTGEDPGLRTTALVGTAPQPVERPPFVKTTVLKPLNVSSITLTSAARQTIEMKEPVELIVKASATEFVADDEDPNKIVHLSQQDQICPLNAVAETRAAAMIAYTLTAPCFANAPITISHNGLTFSEVMPETGALNMLLPALSEEAWVTASFPGGEKTDAVAWIDSVSLYDRVVVQWQGETGIQVHAREFGADYGGDGHVWSGAARDFSAVSDGAGGFLTVLGNALAPHPQQAEIYTFPSALSETEGSVELSVETEVTDANCGKVVRARAMQYMAGRNVSTQDLALSVPDCDAIGSFLVLNNLLQDLTVASK